MVKNLPAMQDTYVRSLGWEDLLQKEMATHYSILAWRIPGTEEHGSYSPWCHKELDMTEQLNSSLCGYIINLLIVRLICFSLFPKFRHQFSFCNFVFKLNKLFVWFQSQSYKYWEIYFASLSSPCCSFPSLIGNAGNPFIFSIVSFWKWANDLNEFHLLSYIKSSILYTFCCIFLF